MHGESQWERCRRVTKVVESSDGLMNAVRSDEDAQEWEKELDM